MAKKTTKKSSPTPKKPSAKKVAKLSTPKRAVKPAAKPAKTVEKTTRKPLVVKPAPKTVVKVAKPAKPARTTIVVENKPVVPAPEKIKTILGRRDLEKFRELLLEKRRELLGDVSSMEDEALRNSGNTNLSNLPIHMADMGTDNYEQEFTLGLVEKDRKVLREIHAALMKIKDGTYGICEGTGKPISKTRLEAQPWTRYSIEHARKLEQRRI